MPGWEAVLARIEDRSILRALLFGQLENGKRCKVPILKNVGFVLMPRK